MVLIGIDLGPYDDFIDAINICNLLQIIFYHFHFHTPELIFCGMYYLKELNHSLKLHPAFFTANLKDHLKKRLLAEVEGSCSGRYGYIVCVLKIIKIDKGIINLDGHAEYQIKYQCIVSKPFKGEVVEGIVNSVNKMGFFCEVGPLNVFISTHLIDNSFAFDPNGNPPCFTDGSSDLKIQKGASIRLKLVGIKADASQIFAIGSIKEDYLGIVSN